MDENKIEAISNHLLKKTKNTEQRNKTFSYKI